MKEDEFFSFLLSFFGVFPGHDAARQLRRPINKLYSYQSTPTRRMELNDKLTCLLT